MMDNILYEFKDAWRKPNNALPQIIILNVVIFLALVILNLLGNINALSGINHFIQKQFAIPSAFSEFILRPWTIITYAFSHDLGGVLHILFNMIFLYWFGKLIVEYLGNQKLINIYVLGAITGAVLYLLAYNTIPGLIGKHSNMVGASGAVYAVVLAAATLVPNYTFFLLFFGPVRIKYIALFCLATSLIGLNGANVGGNLAHLGGGFIGVFYVKQLQAGTDWGKWIYSFMRFVKSFFVRQPKMKVSSQKRSSSSSGYSGSKGSTASNIADQAEIDKILDKISQSGYESLSKEEKQKLFNASKKG